MWSKISRVFLTFGLPRYFASFLFYFWVWAIYLGLESFIFCNEQDLLFDFNKMPRDRLRLLILKNYLVKVCEFSMIHQFTRSSDLLFQITGYYSVIWFWFYIMILEKILNSHN